MPSPLARYRTLVADLDERLRSSLSGRQIALLVVLAVVAVVERSSTLFYRSADYSGFVLLWYNQFQVSGIHALADNFYTKSSYQPFYIYFLGLGNLVPNVIGPGQSLIMVKLICLLFDVLVAWGVYLLVRQLTGNRYRALLAALIVMCLPEVFLNSGMWGQVDAAYTAAALFAAYHFMRHRPILGWVMVGLGLAFKTQTFFILPAAILLFFLQRHRWYAPLIGVAAYFATWIPALLAGKDLRALIMVYGEQVKSSANVPLLTENLSNIYAVFGRYAQSLLLQRAGYAITLLLVVAFCLWQVHLWRRAGRQLSDTRVVQIFAASALLVPYFFPFMHERYFYMAAVFIAVLAMVDRRYVFPAILLQVANCINYIPYLIMFELADPYSRMNAYVLPTFPLTILALILVLRSSMGSDTAVAGWRQGPPWRRIYASQRSVSADRTVE